MQQTEMLRNLAACFDAQASRAPFSGVVLMERGAETFFRAAGFADLEGKVPIRRDTRFRLASVTKVITMAAVGRLAQEGRIEFDAPVGKYVSGLPEPLAEVTIDQLLQHRGGVPRLEVLEGADYDRLMAARRATDLLPLIVSRPIEFAPGSRFGYSNGGYMLLGMAIEGVTGKTFGEAVEELVHRPLGMRSSSLEADRRMARPITSQGAPTPGRPVVYRHWNRIGVPSGNSVSTADDMMRLSRALMADEFISPAVKARLLPRGGPGPGIFQSGNSAGVDTAFIMSPTTGWRVVVLSNRDGPAGELMTRALVGVAGIFGDPECAPPSTG